MHPAIQLAEKGFVLAKDDLRLINDKLTDLKSQPNVAAIFQPHGRPLQVGSACANRPCSHVKTISRGGTDAFYQGSIAETIVTASQKHKGILTGQDFLDYTVEWQTRLSVIIGAMKSFQRLH